MSAPSAAAIASGKLAVVTGAAGGMGLAASRAFADSGMQIVLVDRPGEALQKASASIAGAVTLPTDVADRAAMNGLANGRRERRSFIVALRRFDETGHMRTVDTPGVSLWTSALDYVARHPGDPRAPEALYRLIRVARWGGNHDHIGRRAFLLLHPRYASSEWTRRSPVYYD